MEPRRIGEFMWQAMPNGPEKAQAYLCSREWAEAKRPAQERSKGLCERCRLHPYSAIHHATYIRHYKERPDDLIALCEGCHSFLHGKSDVDPAKVKPPISELEEAVSMEVLHGEGVVCCPVCHFDYSHILEVYTACGSDKDEPESGVYKGTVENGRVGERRSALVVVFGGECEHIWKVTIQQHKGQNFVTSLPCTDSETERYLDTTAETERRNA